MLFCWHLHGVHAVLLTVAWFSCCFVVGQQGLLEVSKALGAKHSYRNWLIDIYIYIYIYILDSHRTYTCAKYLVMTFLRFVWDRCEIVLGVTFWSGIHLGLIGLIWDGFGIGLRLIWDWAGIELWLIWGWCGIGLGSDSGPSWGREVSRNGLTALKPNVFWGVWASFEASQVYETSSSIRSGIGLELIRICLGVSVYFTLLGKFTWQTIRNMCC